MLNREELVNTAILTRLSYFHLNAMVGLYRTLGSATAIMEQRKDLGSIFPGLPKRVLADINDMASTRDRAEEELTWADDHGVKALCLNDDGYPDRMKEAPDAPLMLFYKGTANLNARHIINIVGTRHCTRYGEDLIRAFVRDLHAMVPDTIVVSGLAYGVDIHAHREALANGMDTVAVLAHGLDTLYPPTHRDDANRMVSQGGLITEYMTRTKTDKLNFVRRNRITAGLCDATILVESARKGGLIRGCGAGLITSAEDFVKDMGWENEATLEKARSKGIERSLFPDLTEDEQKIVGLLKQANDLRQDMISVKTGINAGNLTALLFQLEMKGVVKAYAGGTYHLMA